MTPETRYHFLEFPADSSVEMKLL